MKNRDKIFETYDGNFELVNVGIDRTGVPGHIRIFADIPVEPEVEYIPILGETPPEFAVRIQTLEVYEGDLNSPMVPLVKQFVELNRDLLLQFWHCNDGEELTWSWDDTEELISKFTKVT